MVSREDYENNDNDNADSHDERNDDDEIDFYDNGKGDLTTKAILRWTVMMLTTMMVIHMMIIIVIIMMRAVVLGIISCGTVGKKNLTIGHLLNSFDTS